MPQTQETEALLRIKALISERHLGMHDRLPPERELAALVGVSRGTLRKALARLESEGQVWRHVGRGTYVGSRPPDEGADLGAIGRRVSPAQAMEARLALEPELARLAAMHSTAADIRDLEHCARKSRVAESWRVYETWDDRIHRAIAQATHNVVLLSLFDTMNALRRAAVWDRERVGGRPPRDHHSFAEHEALIRAVADRDAARAETAMRAHLDTVRRNLLEQRPPRAMAV